MIEIESGYMEEICMKLKYGEYELVFDEGGVRIEKRGVGLYSNRSPMFVYVKTREAVTEFYDAAYVHTEAVAGSMSWRNKRRTCLHVITCPPLQKFASILIK